jgi:hypothetical protein
MASAQPRFCFAVILVSIGVAAAAAQTSSSRESTSTRDARSTSTSRIGKGPLPDPALLDGSALEPEKRPEHGMLGEFEMGGDENAKSDKVGGESSGPPPPPGGASAPSAIDLKTQIPKSGGGASADAAPEAPSGGAASEGPAGGAGSNQPGLKNDPNAKAEGMQVGELKSDGAGGQSGQSAPSPNKPQQVALGDSAMQIKPQNPAPGVVGAQQLPQGKDTPQQYDTKTPGGGKQSGGSGNQGVEKGRVMPSGI